MCCPHRLISITQNNTSWRGMHFRFKKKKTAATVCLRNRPLCSHRTESSDLNQSHSAPPQQVICPPSALLKKAYRKLLHFSHGSAALINAADFSSGVCRHYRRLWPDTWSWHLCEASPSLCHKSGSPQLCKIQKCVAWQFPFTETMGPKLVEVAFTDPWPHPHCTPLR